MPTKQATTPPPLSHLPYNYCVRCGSAVMPDLFLCALCVLRGEEAPTEYQSAQKWHCTYCNVELDRARDFWHDGSFRSDDYFCLGCDYVSEQGRYFNNRGYGQRALHYLTFALSRRDLPVHIAQAYQRQLEELPQHGIYIEEAVTPGD